jgi:hypothetical protein
VFLAAFSLQVFCDAFKSILTRAEEEA